jgi:hypothetical protein
LTESLDDALLPAEAIAGGGKVNAISNDDTLALSFARRSVEDPGVGGRPGRGMMAQSRGGTIGLIACSGSQPDWGEKANQLGKSLMN